MREALFAEPQPHPHPHPKMRWAAITGATVAMVAVAMLVVIAVAVSTGGVLETAIREASLVAHLRALHEIALVHGGCRTDASGGFAASAEYVEAQLAAVRHAGSLVVFRQSFTAQSLALLSAPTMALATPAVASFAFGTDFKAAYSVSDTLVALPLRQPTNGSSGCAAVDFGSAFGSSGIALIRSLAGECTPLDKYNAAVAAGARAVVLIKGPDEALTFSQSAQLPRLLFLVRHPVGEQLAAIPEAQLSMQLLCETRELSSFNLFAETAAGSEDSVIIVGAHLDSTSNGPGINDNGSGAAGVLELALQAAKRGELKGVKNKVRFVWWGLEESGLLGSVHYLSALNDTERRSIMAVINADMIASPNFAFFVANASQALPAAQAGSVRLQALFETYIESAGFQTGLFSLYALSDHYPFVAAGIPATLLIGGAYGTKSKEERAAFGGFAGLAYDGCYHKQCDDLGNFNGTELTVFSALCSAFHDLPKLTLCADHSTARAMAHALKAMWQDENLRATMRPDAANLAASPSHLLHTELDIAWEKAARYQS